MTSVVRKNERLLAIDAPLRQAIDIVRSNLKRDEAPQQHVLVVAGRGGGKTTFLSAIAEAIASEPALRTRTAVILVGSLEVGTAGPDSYLDRITAALDSREAQTRLDFGHHDEASWTAALARLDAVRHKTTKTRRRLIVLLIDGFDDALKRAFAPKEAQSRLRQLLQSERDLMLVGAVDSADVQRDYDERLFQSFLEIDLPAIAPTDIARLAPTPAAGCTAASVTALLGGSPRRSQIALDVLKREPDLAPSALIDRIIAHETAAFEALLAPMPIRQRRVLDAILVDGEPNRPTGLAALLGTNQADIADAVRLLAADRVIDKTERSTTRRAYYKAADRLFAYWYARERGGPAYLADLADIIAFATTGGEGAELSEVAASDSRAVAYRCLESWADRQSDLGQAAKRAAAATIRSTAAGLLEDAADLFDERLGRPTAATILLRAAGQTSEKARNLEPPDVTTTLRVLRSGCLARTSEASRSSRSEVRPEGKSRRRTP